MTTAVDQLIGKVRQRLQEFGIAIELGPARQVDAGVDAIATLSRGTATARYALVVKEPMTLGVVAHGSAATPRYPLLVVGDHVGRRSAAALREADFQYVDAVGNAFIAFGDVLVEVHGRTGPVRETTDSGGHVEPRRKPANLFSPRRSQVILALLAWPELSTRNIRAIATAAGVSVGQAHDALTLLERARFVRPATRRLDRADELLDYWTAAYPSGLDRRLDLARYHGDPSRTVSRPDAGQPIYLSGESAQGTEIARPATLTVYLSSLDPALPIANRWSARPDRAPNIFVRHKFWTSPLQQEERPLPTAHNAPWPLVYADLVSAGDARTREAARAWRAGHVRPREM